MKEKRKEILLYIFIGLSVFYVLGTGIWDLVNVNARHTVRIEYAVPLIRVEQSINGIFPMGTDYYYVGIEENSRNAYVIQAGKKWLEKSFTQGQSVEVTAIEKKYGKFSLQKEIESALAATDAVDYPLGMEKYLNLLYIKKSYMKIISIIVLAGVIGIYKYCEKRERTLELWQKRVLLFIFFVDLIVMLQAIL